MNPLVLFVLGLLIGWLVEWVIDWFFWRRKYRTLEEENAELKAQLEDDLQDIKGIGPVFAARLNKAGVHDFQDLAKLNKNQLREIVGAKIEKLVDKEGILKQARQLAKKR
jgi:predicted flap endonuclease-1-like 5' DNA nuclease